MVDDNGAFQNPYGNHVDFQGLLVHMTLYRWRLPLGAADAAPETPP